MVEWQDYIHQLLTSESVLDGLDLSIGEDQVTSVIPPIIKASISLLDKMQDHQGMYNILVFPEKVQSIFVFTLTKLLYNISVGKIGREYDPTKFTAGEKLRLGNAVVEFVEVEERAGLTCVIFRTAENMTSSVPLKLLPFFQRTSTNRKLSKYKQYVEAKRAAESAWKDLDAGKRIISLLADYKTHMENSIFYMTSVVNTKELLHNCLLCGHRISDLLFFGQTDYSGNIRNMGAGQLSGKPAIVLASDLYSITAAINAGNPAQSVIIDVSNAETIVSQMDQIDELMRIGIPITCVTDTVNSFDLRDLKTRGFNVWRWDDTSITSELYDATPLSSDRKNKHCAQQIIEYMLIDGLASGEAMKALSAHRNEIQDQSAQIMKLYDDLYSLAFIALRETTPLTDSDIARAKASVNTAFTVLENERAYISPSLYEDLKFAAKNLGLVFTDGYCPMKQKALAERLSQQRESSIYNNICIIVPERFEKTHVEAFWRNWIAENGLQSSITVLSPGEYYPLVNAGFSITIISGWLRRAIMRKILFSFNSAHYLVLLYDYERKWKNYDVRKWNADIDRTANKRVIQKSFSSEKFDISVSRFVDHAETVESDGSTTDELNEIEQVLKENKFRQYVARGGTKSVQSTVDAIPVSFVGGFMAFYHTGHKIVSATKVITEDADKIDLVLPDALRVGDFVVIRESDHDLIREMADNILEKEGKLGLRETASKWREALEIEKLFSTPEEICQRLADAGCTREPATISRWLFDDDLISPQQKQDIQYIADITGSSVLQEMLDQVVDAGRVVKAAHSQAGRILSEKLRERIAHALEEYGDIDPFNIWEPIEMNIDDIGLVRILKIIDIGSVMVVDRSDTNRLIEE